MLRVKTHPSMYNSGLRHRQLFGSVLTCNTNKTIQNTLSLVIVKELAQIIKLRISHCTKNSLSYSENNNLGNEQNPDNKNELKDKLIKWAIQCNVSHLSFSKLLKVLSEHGLQNLPKNSAELLKEKEGRIKTSLVPPGTYTHYGLERNLKTLVEGLLTKKLFNKTEIGVSIFIDHLPLVKFTGYGLWVILGSVEGFTKNVFFIGAYSGHSKPKNANSFLSKFVEEAKYLCTNGVRICDKHYDVGIKRLICDAPAKYFLLNLKSYSGYSSCTKCRTVGQYRGRNICFLGKGTPKTDEDFRSEDMYLGYKTNLLEIPNFGVVSNVTLDYMHLVCLGVLRRLLNIWLQSKKHWTDTNSAPELLKNFDFLRASEFRKKIKLLSTVGRWSGSELRCFLLYSGPVLLKDNLKEDYYQHFLFLHVACRLLCIETTTENVNRGRKLFNKFIYDYKKLYSEEQITHNIHGLYHLADECAYHGTLDSFSAFPFEEFLLKLRNTMEKCKKRTIPQVILKESYDKIFEKNLSKLTSSDYKILKLRKNPLFEDDLLTDYYSYEKLSVRNFQINPNIMGDKYLLLKNGKVIEVTDVLRKKERRKQSPYFVAGKEFTSILNFYPKPYDSFQLDMFNVSKLSDKVNIWPVDMIDKKCMKVPSKEGNYVMVGLLEENF